MTLKVGFPRFSSLSKSGRRAPKAAVHGITKPRRDAALVLHKIAVECRSTVEIAGDCTAHSESAVRFVSLLVVFHLVFHFSFLSWN